MSKDEVAEKLIDWHFQTDPGLKEVYRFITENEDAPNEPIKLLEVSKETFPSGRVDTFTFAPAGDIIYPMTIATVTPEEMKQIREGSITLPKGWDLSRSRSVQKPKRSRRTTSKVYADR